ncbi:MAG TPA: hypothetical protein VJH06_04015 [Candidatus Paceibacterota bacterium]
MDKKFENMHKKVERVKRLEEEARKSPNPLFNPAHSELKRLMVHDDELSHEARAALYRLMDKQRIIIQRKIRDGDGGTGELNGSRLPKDRIVSINQKIKTKNKEIGQVVKNAEAEIRNVEAPLPRPKDEASKKEKIKLGAIVSIRDQLREIQRNGFNSRRQRELTLVALSYVDFCNESGGEMDAHVEGKLEELLKLIKGDSDNYGDIMNAAKSLDKILEEDENKIRSKTKEIAA